MQLRPVNPARVFAVLAAAFLVAAVALGSLLPIGEPMGQVLADLNGSWPADLQAFVTGHLGGWIWQSLVVPVLVRPSWLLPVGAGILCLGAVTSLAWLNSGSRPRRRRS